MKQPVVEREGTRSPFEKPGRERRRSGLRCVSCGSARCEVTAGENGISFRCLECASRWSERRTTARFGPHSAPASEATHAAVLEICRAADAGAIAVALEWVQRLTQADRVTFASAVSRICCYRDRDGAVGEMPLSEAHLLTAIPTEARLICELAPDAAIAGRLADARSVVCVPVNRPDASAAIAAYWVSGSAPTISHLQTMQLLADAVGSRTR